MIIKEIIAHSGITKSKLPESDYVANPYVGCSHGCVYCYARFMKRFTGHEEPWGTFVDIKSNFNAFTEHELEKIGADKTILLSSVTDPYQPVENRWQLTRSFLERVVGRDVKLSILTKSSLVVRDVDILRRIRNVEAGFSFSSVDENVRKIFEPGASSTEKRMEALNLLHQEGIATYIFLGPILPEITDIEEVMKTAKATGVKFVMAESLNMNGSIYPSVMRAINEHYPHLSDIYAQIKTDPSTYWNSVERNLRELSTSYQLPIKLFFHHGSNKKD